MYQIWDVQTEALLADGLSTLDRAHERLEELLAETRHLVETTGDSVEEMALEWEIRDASTGEVVAGHWGAPVPLWE